MNAKLIEPTKEILARIGDYYYGSDDIVIEQALMNIINKSFSIYDGVTNGALYTFEKPRFKSFIERTTT